jgi:hypothetical protein
VLPPGEGWVETGEANLLPPPPLPPTPESEYQRFRPGVWRRVLGGCIALPILLLLLLIALLIIVVRPFGGG